MKHPVYDKDPHFSLDIDTRALTSTMRKVSLIQGDHNSERFTFDLPAEIEGHKLVDCDKVEVHFINIDINTKAQSKGFYSIDDLQPHETDPTKVVCSWLIDGRATKYVGSLSFVIRVTCLEGSNLRYAWHTAIYTGITVSDGICCLEATVEQYVDVLEAWRLEIEAGRRELEQGRQTLDAGLRVMEANRITNFRQTQVGGSDGGRNKWALTLGDGRELELQINNGCRGPAGPTGLVGSIETVDGKRMDFFQGTQADYDALPDALKANLFAVITDEEFDEKVEEAVVAFSTPMYMVWVHVTGYNAGGLVAGVVAAHFCYMSSTKRDGDLTRATISEDLWNSGVGTVPASGFYQTSSSTQPRAIIAVNSVEGNGLQFKYYSSVNAEESSEAITDNWNLKFTAKSQKLTGGQ